MIKTLSKFNIGDTVTYMDGAINRRLIAKVQYIQYDFYFNEWVYNLTGVPGEFKENQLDYWFIEKFVDAGN